MTDFALLPPEVNSGRMYSGPGAGPLLAAAAAWDGLGAELTAVRLGYHAVLTELATTFAGSTATAMTAAAAPYLAWLHATAGQAEHTAGQARAATAAYEAAFAMTVPPPVVAANRALWAALVTTNILGQNTPAILAADAHYAQMWAQDAAAMYGYAAAAAAAAVLAPFGPPPQTTNPAGAAHQAGAVGAAAATAAGHPQTVTTAVSGALQGLTAPAVAAGSVVELGAAGAEVLVDSIGTFGVDVLGTFMIDAIGAAEIGGELLPIAEGLLPFGGLANAVSPVSATLTGAGSVGRLSVPPTWTGVVAAGGRSLGGALPAAAVTVAAEETSLPLAEMATTGLAGRATAGIGRVTNPVAKRPEPQRAEERLRPELGLLMGADIELRELAELRYDGVLTDDEYAAEKRLLVGQ